MVPNYYIFSIQCFMEMPYHKTLSLRLLKCGKSRAFPTFPQPLLFLFENNNPNKITTRGGEDGAKRAKSSRKPVPKPYLTTNLTILEIGKGYKN